jgi:hypothetical protein
MDHPFVLFKQWPTLKIVVSLTVKVNDIPHLLFIRGQKLLKLACDAEGCPMALDEMWCGRNLQMLRRNILPPFSE